MPAGRDVPIRKKAGGSRIVITGKGGVGKTTATALLAHLCATQGIRVLAVDADPQQNLALALGVPPLEADRIVPLSQSTGYIREKMSAGAAISPGGLLTLNPDVSDVIDRFSLPVAADLRLLVMGGVRQAGSGCLCPEYTLLAAVLRHITLHSDGMILLDTPAGLEHFGRGVADGFDSAIVIADPSRNAISVARESAVLARQLGINDVMLVVNRVGRLRQERHLQMINGEPALFRQVICVPFEPAVLSAEPSVTPLFQQESEFLDRIRELATAVTGQDIS
jgi:CO dehydrogenase maturation factor